MHVPKYFQVDDFKEIEKFIQSNSFGMIVTVDQGKPIATHVPLILDKKGDDYYICGHLAKTNPQCNTLKDNQNVLIIYQGHILTFLQRGMKKKMYLHGIIKQFIYMVNQVY